MHKRLVLGLACLLTTFVVMGCGEPPRKEMDQAQGAIDAARAARADVYAVTEYVAATEALKNADEAAAARDFRLALSNALESREFAQNAARVSADTQAKARADVERSTEDITALMAHAKTGLTAARSARVATRVLFEPAAAIEVAVKALQESGEAMATGDYLAATEALTGVRARLDKAVTTIDAARQPPPRLTRPRK